MQTHAQRPSRRHPIEKYIRARRAKNPRYSKLALAEEIGVSRNALYRVINGDDAVSTDLLEKIERATRGRINALDLFAAWKRRRKRPKRRAKARAH